jgi:uncharacterized protein YjbJ (UPF0337 family)
MDGTTDKIKGNVKEAVGKATGDTRIEAEGKTDKVKGEAKDAVEDAKEGMKGVKDSVTR